MSTIRQLRKAKGLSQEKLGELARVSRVVIWRMETGQSVQPLSLDMVCTALGVSREVITGVNVYSAAEQAARRKKRV